MERFKTAKQLKEISRENLFGNYGVLIFTYAFMSSLMFLIRDFIGQQTGSTSAIYYAACFIIILLYSAFTVGQYWMYRKVVRSEKPTVADMWTGFKYHADKAIMIQLILFIPTFVCAIPLSLAIVLYTTTKNPVHYLTISGTLILYLVIIVLLHLNFSQAFFLLIDHPDESCVELLKHSMRIMRGNKLRLFYLYASFAGIGLLVILSFGIGILWAYPYITCARTLFYEELYAREPGKHIDVTVA